MSTIRVVSRIFPINGKPEDFSNLLKPSDLGTPIEVNKYSVVDPRTGMKYIVESTFCIDKNNIVDCEKIPGLININDISSLTEKSEQNFNFTIPRSLPKERTMNLLKHAKAFRSDKNIQKPPSIKLHLNLKKIREDARNSIVLKKKEKMSILKKKEKLLDPLLKYCVKDECLICGIILKDSNMNIVLAHMNSHLKLGTYSCVGCENRCFSTAKALYKHSLRCLEKKQYKCDSCFNKFNRKYFLSKHYEKDHPRSPLKSSNKNRNAIRQAIPTCFVCTICKENLTSIKLLSGHKKAHGDKENYLCLFCNQSFSTSSLLHYHTHYRIVVKYSCKVCQKTFASAVKLREHKKIHFKKASFVCKTCGKSFNFQNSLRNHIQLHR